MEFRSVVSFTPAVRGALLLHNGYGSVDVHASAGLSRPLLIGQAPLASVREEPLAARA